MLKNPENNGTEEISLVTPTSVVIYTVYPVKYAHDSFRLFDWMTWTWNVLTLHLLFMIREGIYYADMNTLSPW